jgi:hypothetical protein
MTPLNGYKTWRPLWLALFITAGIVPGLILMQVRPESFRYRGLWAVALVTLAPVVFNLVVARLIMVLPGMIRVDAEGLWWQGKNRGGPEAVVRFKEIKRWRFSSSLFDWFIPILRARKPVILEFWLLTGARRSFTAVLASEDEIARLLGSLDHAIRSLSEPLADEAMEPARTPSRIDTSLRQGLGILIVAAGVIALMWTISTGVSYQNWHRGPRWFVISIAIIIVGVRIVMGR